MFCGNCGKQVDDHVQFCPYCGNKNAIGKVEKSTEDSAQNRMIDQAAGVAEEALKKGGALFEKAVKAGSRFGNRFWIGLGCGAAGLTVLLVFLFAIDVLGHKWEPATCAAPKTCSKCGATRGKTLEHEWEPATCAAPKTCSKCGATEGEALEHDWQAATATEAKTCRVCGATEGQPLGNIENVKSVLEYMTGCTYRCSELLEWMGTARDVDAYKNLGDSPIYFSGGWVLENGEDSYDVIRVMIDEEYNHGGFKDNAVANIMRRGEDYPYYFGLQVFTDTALPMAGFMIEDMEILDDGSVRMVLKGGISMYAATEEGGEFILQPY